MKLCMGPNNLLRDVTNNKRMNKVRYTHATNWINYSNEVKIVINWSLIIEFIIQEISSVRFSSRRSISLSSTFSITRHIRQLCEFLRYRTFSLSPRSICLYIAVSYTLLYVKYIIELFYANALSCPVTLTNDNMHSLVAYNEYSDVYLLYRLSSNWQSVERIRLVNR